MEGQELSHYKVLEKLGGGGMGVVHRALDTRLNRHVTLKFLPHELTRDDEARQRFVQEAQAASALDHPNICTIHEIDSTPEGQMFIAMAYYEGETLKKVIARGPTSIDQALDIAAQIAKGLAKAHSAGIVHRDIKPANVMFTDDGLVKILDFGIAKLLGVTGPTQAGSTIGTVSYMAPEQAAGDDAEPQSDLWALGVVLYEMLTGKLPFPGENQWAVMNGIMNNEPARARSLRTDLPREVDEIVMGAIERDRSLRVGSALAMITGIRSYQAGPATAPAVASTGASNPFLKPAFAIPGVAVLALVGLWGGWLAFSGEDVRRAREELIPEMLAFIEQDSYAAAFVLAEEIESLIPNDPVLTDALAVSSVTGAIRTDPVGADVYVRAYGEPDAEWRFLGPSPLEAVRLPRSASVQLRVEAEGYATRVVASGAPGFYFGRGSPDVITLLPENEVPPEMVLIQGGDYPVRITGFNSGARIPMDAFLMDRHEVTNMEYKEFVDAGGYDQAEYWEGFDFVREGRPLSSEAAIAELVDASGRPGPATWEFGNFPQGQADYPVAGVSWYEAVAYLQFRDKSLPTIYHWARAAMEPHANATPLSTAMIPLANFGSDGPVPVGSTGAMAPHGALDLAGNVREWQWNAAGEHRWILGGAWDDETRMHSVRFTSPPFDRSSRHGFRGVRHLAGDPRAELMEPVDLQVRDHRDAVAVSDEIYEVYRSQMAYVPTELNESVEWRHEDPADWVIEHVTVDVSPDERMSIYLFLPKSVGPPYTPVVYFPGLGPFMQPPPEHSGDLMREEDLNSSARMVMQSGRAIVLPIWDGSFERWDDFLTRSGEEYLRSFRDRMADWAADVGRTIDLLERRDDISTETIGYMGSSFGASTTLALLGLEPRLGAALLLLPGYTYRDLPPEADAVNYAPRITMPVLMIGGRYDYVFPLETAQQPLYDQLGTPTAQKTFLTYEMGHGPFPRNQLLRDVLPWLDQYLPIVN